MIILLTGKPGVGKSTIIEKVISGYEGPAPWVVTKEIRDDAGERVGFQALNSDGKSEVISHKRDIQSDVIIGQNRVNLGAVDRMFAGALASVAGSGDPVIIDEIGPIQLLSAKFAAELDEVFVESEGVNILATIHYSDDRLSKYRLSENAWLFEVTSENREVLPQIMVLCLNHLAEINKLSPHRQRRLYDLIKSYLNDQKFLQINKLILNAIYYVNDGAIRPADPGQWFVKGRHGEYEVRQSGDAFTCTCDLFNGRGKYAGNAGECSHIQAVKIYEAQESKL